LVGKLSHLNTTLTTELLFIFSDFFLILEILPNSPENVLVDIISETALKISWTRPSRNYGTVTHYYVNISALAGFDSLTDTRESIDRNSKAIDSNQSFEMQVKVNKYLRIQNNVRITATPKVKIKNFVKTEYGFLF